MSFRRLLLAFSLLPLLPAVLPAQLPGADLRPELIKPSEADPGIKTYNDNNIVLRPARMTGAPIFLWMPGTSGKPEYTLPFLRVAASQGYRVLGLAYPDEPAVSQVCPRIPEPSCADKFREMRLYGTGSSPDVHNAANESITGRLVALLQLLAKRHPNEGWQAYLTQDNKPDWSKFAVAGQSQGAGMAAFIAKQHKVYRAILFSSPIDSTRGASKFVFAPWLYWPSATPPDRWYAERNTREPFNAGLIESYPALGIPADHVHVFSLDLPARMDASNPMSYHGVNIKDPRYLPEWKQLFGNPAAGSIPASATVPNASPATGTPGTMTLSCNLPPTPGRPANHLDFFVDQPHNTVSLISKGGSAKDQYTAIFTPVLITWTIDTPYGSLTRILNRKDLTFIEELTVQNKKTSQPGQCTIALKP